MGGPGRVFAFVLTTLWLVTSVGAQTAPAFVEATLAGDALAEGTLAGSCQAIGVVPEVSARRFLVEAERITIDVVETRRNETAVAGQFVQDATPSQSHDEVDVRAGPVELELGSRGVVAAYPRGGPGSAETFLVGFDGTQWTAGPYAAQHESPLEPVFFRDAAFQEDVSFVGWSREVTFNGTVDLHGNVTLLVKEATLRWPGGEKETGPARTTVSSLGSGSTRREEAVYRHAVIHLEHATWRLPSNSSLYCAHTTMDVDGALTAAAATGEAGNKTGRQAFDERLIQVAGVFRLEEQPPSDETGRSRLRLEGDFTAMGLDFGAVPAPRAGLMPVAAALGIALFLASAWVVVNYLGSMVGFYYSRFGRDEVLENSNRELVYQAVLNNPGADLSDLTRVTPFHLTTVVYHVQVLRRVGLVGTMRHGRSLRVLPKELMHKDGMRQVVTARDERLAKLTELVRGGKTEVKALVDSLVQLFTITPRAAYMMIDRAVERGLIVRSGSTRGGIVQCAQ